MQTASGAFSAATLAGDQMVDKRVIIGFPGSVQASFQDVSPNVVSILPRRSVTSAFSEQATLIAGVSTASLQIVLAGMLYQGVAAPCIESQTIDWLCRPNDPTSPMYLSTLTGLTVTVQMGYWLGGTTPEWVTIYTGIVDTCAVSDGYVTLSCLDGNQTITSPASLPPVITAAPQNSGLTAEYAMERLLRYASPGSYYTRPPDRSNCVLSVGFRSSLWPDIGTYSGFFGSPSFVPGTNGSALFNGSGGYTPTVVFDTAATAFVEFRANGNCMVLLKNQTSGHSVQIQTFSGGLFITTTTASGTATGTVIAVDTTVDHYFGIKVNWAQGSTAVSGTYYYDNGSATAWSFTALNARLSTDTWETIQAFARVTADGALAELQVTREPTPASNGAFVPTAFLDPSLNPLSALPNVTGKSVAGVMQEIAVGEGGVFLFDETNIPRFYNRATIRARTSVTTVTSQQSLQSLSTQHQRSLLATHIQVPYTPLTIQPYQTVWNTADTILIGAAGKYRTIAQTSDPIVALGTSCGIIPAGGLTSGSGYRAARFQDGRTIVDNLIMTVFQLSSQQVSILVYNPNPWPVWLVSPQGTLYADAYDGLPRLAVGAQPVNSGLSPDGTTSTPGGGLVDVQWPDVDSGGAAANQFGDILYAAPQSDWRQSSDAALSMANDLLSDLHYPKILYRNVTIRPNPQLQLTDVVTLVDTDVSQTNTDVLILGSYPRYSAGEWSQDLDIIDLYRPGAWTFGVSVMGVDNYLY